MSKHLKTFDLVQAHTLGMRLRERLLAAWRQLRRWQQLAEQRRQLAQLDERALQDIGLSRADALRECDRPFWDDPLR